MNRTTTGDLTRVSPQLKASVTPAESLADALGESGGGLANLRPGPTPQRFVPVAAPGAVSGE
jgi:hypothetical protein